MSESIAITVLSGMTHGDKLVDVKMLNNISPQ